MKRGNSTPEEAESSVRLQIDEQGDQQMRSSDWESTMFEPERGTGSSLEKMESTANSGPGPGQADPAPEKKLTLFALRLAILEKAASGLGALGFIWATVVLLGGFAITLDKKDFWFITTILLIEGARIFSRSHELEWQHQATWSLTDVGRFSFRALKSSSSLLARTLKAILSPVSPTRQEPRRATQRPVPRNLLNTRNSATRIWSTPEVPLVPYTGWLFLSKNISKLLYWLQLLSASACVTLSLMRLIQQTYGEISKGDSDKRNRKSALNIFYSLALAEALLFLLERAYWEYKVSYCELLNEVNSKCGLGNSGMASIKRFFYDAYSRCVNGSIFDGLKMDLVSFAAELLESDFCDEQLSGAHIIRTFATNSRFKDDTLRKIGTSMPLMERLVEMLNWKKPEEEDIRKAAAEILSNLAGKKQNSLRVAEIPGAMESISSLLYTGRSSSSAPDEICQKNVVIDQANYEFSTFNLLGLSILKKVARDVNNCEKIASTRGLLPKIIDFTHAGEKLSKDKHVVESEIIVVRRSLQLVKMLVGTTGPTGRILRQEISEIVFTISNIRDILQYGDSHPRLQKLGMEILTGLSLDEEAKEKIGRTGGVLKKLLSIFIKQGLPQSYDPVRNAAGEALTMLALNSQNNCAKILRLDSVEKLVGTLEDPALKVNSARILRNLCAYSGADHFHHLKGLTAATNIVLKSIMLEENKLQEVAIGLATQIFRFTGSSESGFEWDGYGISEATLGAKLVQILNKYQYPSIRVPRIRRFVIELAVWMMKDKTANICIFRDLGMEEELESVAQTTSELECFNAFSGNVGLCPHRTTVHSLVETAIELLHQE